MFLFGKIYLFNFTYETFGKSFPKTIHKFPISNSHSQKQTQNKPSPFIFSYQQKSFSTSPNFSSSTFPLGSM